MSQPASGPASGPSTTPASAPRPALSVALTVTASIPRSRLEPHVRHLASDALEGRGASTRGIVEAAGYLESKLRELPVQPAFGASFRQPFELTTGTHLGPGSALAQGKRTFVVERDFAPYPFSASASVEGPLVFAGYGITSKTHGYDDYASLEVEGKIVVILPAEPGEDDPKSPFDGRRPTHHAELRTKLLRAREAKAKAVLVVRAPPKRRGAHQEASADAGIVAAWISPATAKVLLGFDPRGLGAEIDRTFAPRSRASGRPPASIRAEIVRERTTVENIGAVFVPPTATSTESVVIGAHYDHLGFGGWASLAGADERSIHNGADDNASGTAAVLEIARALSTDPGGLRRRVYFVLFAGEESGLLGSAAFVKSGVVEPSSIAAMINLDMVGRLRDRKLNVMGTNSGLELEELARRFVEARGLVGSYGGDGYGPSDHTSFYAAGVPVMFLFTGAHEDYHKPSDDADRVNYAGLAEVSAVATDLARALATARNRPTYVHAPPPAPTAGGGGYGPYFGSIPDFGEQKGGVLLSGVRAGSPAEKAGVRKGDIITRFAGVAVTSLEDLTVALRGSAPGDVVEVVVLRAGAPVTMTAKLEKRGE